MVHKFILKIFFLSRSLVTFFDSPDLKLNKSDGFFFSGIIEQAQSPSGSRFLFSSRSLSIIVFFLGCELVTLYIGYVSMDDGNLDCFR